MGCVESKNEIAENQINVFRVVNIDEHGADLCSGQLEITESDIVLIREGRDSTVWPLHSLRRYGFEGEIFSFESGRRCETGEGIYAFKCRRAATLFHMLQQQIQLRNVNHDPVGFPVQSQLTGTPSPQARQTLQASVVHRSSIDNGADRNVASSHTFSYTSPPNVPNDPQSPRSPFNDILEVTPLNSWSHSNNNHVTNLYQLREFRKDHTNSTDLRSNIHHVYSNDLNRDLAMLRNNLREETIMNNIRDMQDETTYLQNRYANSISHTIDNRLSLSPSVSNNNECHNIFSMEPQDARMYVNIKTNGTNHISDRNENLPTTPQTPKVVEYFNLTVSNKHETNSYANLSLVDFADSHGKHVLDNISESVPNHSESDTLRSVSPNEELEVNYAVLDIDKHKANASTEKTSPESPSPDLVKNQNIIFCPSQSCRKLVSQKSMEKNTNSPNVSVPANVGYTTIDFEKTVALTSVAASSDINRDDKRKSRHSTSNLLSGSPNVKK